MDKDLFKIQGSFTKEFLNDVQMQLPDFDP